MFEDKLMADQRIRLEAVAQANVMLMHSHGKSLVASVADLLEAAGEIEQYVMHGAEGLRREAVQKGDGNGYLRSDR